MELFLSPFFKIMDSVKYRPFKLVIVGAKKMKANHLIR